MTLPSLSPEHLPVSQLQVDHAYQRLLVESQIRWVVNHYDPIAFGRLVVGRRADGSLWVVDGQQRHEAATRLEMDTVPCDVFESTGRTHEAYVFREIGSRRKNLKPYEMYRAAVEAGDVVTLAIQTTVEQCGYRICQSGRRPGENHITAVNTLYGIHRLGGTSLITAVLDIITESWPGDTTGVHNMVLNGLAMFIRVFSDHDNYDRRRLVKKLKAITPLEIQKHVTNASKFSGHGNRSRVFRSALIGLYNKGAKEQYRLPDDSLENTVDASESE